MTHKFKKLTLSVATSALLANSAFALDSAITNFGFSPTCYGECSNTITIFDSANPSKIKTITGGGGTFTMTPTGASAYLGTVDGTVKVNFYDGLKTVVSNT